jgi:hypothetical protein
MPDEMIRMINSFVGWIPDLDILFNEDDECRLVIPWALKQQLLQKEEKSRLHSKSTHFANWYTEQNWPGTLLVKPI